MRPNGLTIPIQPGFTPATRCKKASLAVRIPCRFVGDGVAHHGTTEHRSIYCPISFDFPPRTTYMDVGLLPSLVGPVQAKVFPEPC
jgi:hypothetical protein